MHYDVKAIDKAMKLYKKIFSKLEFLAEFQIIHTQTFRKSIIQLAFKKTGLIFYNPAVIL